MDFTTIKRFLLKKISYIIRYTLHNNKCSLKSEFSD